MGWSHILAVFASNNDISHVALCVLILLAKMADERGESHPSVAYVAEHTKLSERSVRNGLSELKRSGYVTWKSGRHDRSVNRYRLTNRVMNICEQDIKQVGTTCRPIGTTCRPIGTTCRSNVHQVPIRPAPGAYKDTNEDIKEVSLLVSRRGDGASPEELPAKQDNRTQERPPKTAAKSSCNLLKEYGWKPKSRTDVEAAVNHCYGLGASMEEAKAFARYNNKKKWNGINDMTSVHQLAKEWVKIWRHKSPGAWEYEHSRRREDERRAEIARMEKEVEKERKRA